MQEGDPHWIATLRLGLWLYEAMAGRPFGGEVRRLSAETLRRKFPGFRPDALPALRYVDARVQYLNAWSSSSRPAQSRGRASTWASSGSHHRDETGVVGVELSDGRLLCAPLVINATGHWVDQLMQRSESPPRRCCTRPAAAIMLPRRTGHPASGLYVQARAATWAPLLPDSVG